VPEEIFFWTFMVQGKITEADTPTIRLGLQSIRTNQRPASVIRPFYADVLPAATLPIYPVLGQAPNMLACIPSGLVDSLMAVMR